MLWLFVARWDRTAAWLKRQSTGLQVGLSFMVSMLMLAIDYTHGNRNQIYYQPYPAGEPLRFTSDLSNYQSISLDAQQNVLAAVQVDNTSNLYLAPASDPNAMRHGVKVFAWRDIAPGEEITAHYGETRRRSGSEVTSFARTLSATWRSCRAW